MTISILLIISVIISLVTWSIVSSTKPRWKVIFFTVVDDLHHQETINQTAIVTKLKKMYNVDEVTANEAIKRAGEGDDAWFEQTFKD